MLGHQDDFDGLIFGCYTASDHLVFEGYRHNSPNFDFKKDITLAFLNLGASTKYWLSWRAAKQRQTDRNVGIEEIGIKWEICCQISSNNRSTEAGV